jgi:tetratricopeptide (TPR) repeat protein
VCLLLAAGSACALQPGKPETTLEDITRRIEQAADWRQEFLAPAVRTVLSAEYLTDDERAAMRLKHGVWLTEDLDRPGARAHAALVSGRLWDPALSAEDAPVEDRAEAALLRGDPAGAIAALDATPSERFRAVRVRAAALAEMGEREKAAAILRPVRDKYRAERMNDADELVEAVRCVTLLTEVAGAEEAAGEYQEMVGVLARVRTELDPQSWAAPLAEAELLYSKDNMAQAVEAIGQAIAMNPSCADAWTLLGLTAVDQFDAEKTAMVAAKLDQLADMVAPEGQDPGRSPLGAILQARMRLRQSDGAGAKAMIDAALEKAPEMRPLLALRAASVAATYDFEGARKLLAEYDAKSPGSMDGYLAVGKALSESRQYPESAEFLRVAAERAPQRPEPFIELGLMELQSGRDAAAEDALSKAVAMDPFNVRAGNSLEVVRELRTYASVESAHFIVRYNAATDEVLATDMLRPLEEIYTRVTGSERGGIDYVPAEKAVIEVFPDHRWFAVRITGMPDIHTIAASTGPVVAMESPRAGPNSLTGPYDWVRVVRHEYVHTVTLGRTRNRLPHWFTEASAVYLEDAPRDYNRCRLLYDSYRMNAMFDLEEINTGFIRPKRATDRALAYAQGHWMYEFMIERFGDKSPLQLMDDYAAGIREDEAMRKVLGVGRAEFLEQFKTWADTQLIAWGMKPPAGTPTVRELYERELASGADGEDAGAKADGAQAGGAQPAADGPTGGDKPDSKSELEKLLEKTTEDPDAHGDHGGGPGEPAHGPGEPGGEPEDIRIDKPIMPGGKPIIAGGRPVEEPTGPTPEMIEHWLAKYPEHPQVLEVAVSAALEKAAGKPTPEMIPLLERYAAARPVDPLPHKLLARLFLDGAPGGAAAAIPHLEYLDAREQHSNAFAMELAQRYAETGDWSKATVAAERATRIAPYDPRARELAARVAIKRGEMGEAERHIVALTKIEPDRQLHRTRLEALKKQMQN